ncbi:MAG: hypothetical protein BAJALOKI3v1_430013 [Promethearchaeota archaeon]|jgi:hypothetical protein|nr:MAG: hypothetical protein BAJALOKI3v1_430013 [Candidatus Lokiarchaeota archaeon]
MKDLYEAGFVFRGFVLVKHKFRQLPKSNEKETDEDLRGAFISAINTFAQKAFINTSLEYLEMKDLLFTFKIDEIRAGDNNSNKKEPIIMYGLMESQRNPDKYVQKFLEKIEPIIQFFITTYQGADFTELNKFESFEEELKKFFD